MTESLGVIIGLLLTLFVYSYLVGDNPLYRIAVHILIGVSAAYAAIVVANRILIPVVARVAADPSAPDNALWLVPIILSLLLLFRWIRALAWVGNTSVGSLVTIGAAVVLVGAISGTIIPLVTGLDGENVPTLLLVTLLTICVLLYFQFSVRVDEDGEPRTGPGTGAVRMVGQFVLLITFGAVFASVFTTSLIILIERITYLITGLTSLFGLILL